MTHIDCQATPQGVVIQVIGWLSRSAGNPRKFAQTFVLVTKSQGSKQLLMNIANDIFHYLSDDSVPSAAAAAPAQEQEKEPAAPAPAAEAKPKAEPAAEAKPKAEPPAPAKPAPAPVKAEEPKKAEAASEPKEEPAAAHNPEHAQPQAQEKSSGPKSWAQLTSITKPAAQAASAPAQAAPAQAAAQAAAAPAVSRPAPAAAAASSAAAAPSAAAQQHEGASAAHEKRSPSTIIVKNVAVDATEKELHDMFSRIGAIRPNGIQIHQSLKRKDAKDGKPSCYAFIEYVEEESAKKAIEERKTFSMRDVPLYVDDPNRDRDTRR